MMKPRLSDKIHTLPAFDRLSGQTQAWFNEIDISLQENFWGNLALLKQAELKQDPYIHQLKEMGYCFEEGRETPVPFYQSIQWVFSRLHQFLKEGIVSSCDVLWPARVFECTRTEDNRRFLYRVIGEPEPDDAIPVNLVTPHVFVSLLAHGYYPVGNAIREHTNQTLAEHDLAHLAGFLSLPDYMRTVREGFRRIFTKMQHNPALKNALLDYNSVYSLRLYYMTEIFTHIPLANLPRLQQLLEWDITRPVKLQEISLFLTRKAEHPAALYRYLHAIYDKFSELVNPLGGESRDILNRTRKFSRRSQLGTFYPETAFLSSKFDGSSIYSLYQNGAAALLNKRSNHPDFLKSLREIHAPFIGTLIGTSQLTVEDWVLPSVEETPDPRSKLYQYLCGSGLWNPSHLIYLAHSCKDYTRILPAGTYARAFSA